MGIGLPERRRKRDEGRHTRTYKGKTKRKVNRKWKEIEKRSPLDLFMKNMKRHKTYKASTQNTKITHNQLQRHALKMTQSPTHLSEYSSRWA